MEDDIEDTRKQIKELNVKKAQVTDPNDMDEEDQDRFNAYITKAKRYIGEGRIEDALRLNKKALALCHSDKLAKKIKKMEEYLKNRGEESEDDDAGMTHLGKGFYLYKELHDKLYVHQQEGVLWLWSLYRQKKGGILGDDMGLGKTIQVIAFLSGMFDMQKISSVLIVLPVAVMVNWENECKKWSPGLKVVAYHGSSKREKERALARVQKRGGICFTTYGLVVTSWEQLGTQDGREFVWDYMILDEGHKIKNPTKTSKGVHAIPARNRIILTGTPVQNNLKELWALFDFVHQGSLLGTQRTFKMEYETPITRAREKDATKNEKLLGMEMAQSLKNIISPFFLRRTKAEVKERERREKKGETNSTAKHAVMPTMTRKNDLIVWTFLSKAQLQIYEDFLHLDTVKELLMTSKSPLVALNVLKKICDHPRLLSTRACSQLGIEDEELDDELLETETGNLSAVTRIQHIADHVLVNESGKLVFLVNLLDQLKKEGHRCLVFSQSRKMLDIMQKVMTNRGHKIMRLDGTISQVYEREQRIKKFQSDNSYSVFLLTTQVGGVGLTLTAADRVVIYDPSWNPATDAQAVDRVFRIGQNKNVVIYRLITCGTVEEKIYRRQVFKDSITRQTTGNAKNPYRYFSKYELKELFTLNDPTMSTTQQQLEQMHSGQRLTDPSLDEHIAFLYSLEMFGLSDHDLMFSPGTEGTDEDMSGDEQEVEATHETDYIQHRVQKAQELLQMESQQDMPLEERQGKHQAPSAPAVQRSHLWDFPKPQQDDADQSDPEVIPSDDEVESNTSSQQDDKNLNVTIDLTSPVADRQNGLKPKADPDTEAIDLTTPLVKRESLTHDTGQESEEEDMEVGGNTPKKHNYRTPIKTNTPGLAHGEEEMQIGGNTPRGDAITSDRQRQAAGDGVKSEPSTPKSKIVREGLFISPEPSQPLVQTMPLKTESPRHGNISKFNQKLNASVFGNVESPDVGPELLNGKHGTALVGDSPAVSLLGGSHINAIVEDSPNRSRSSVGGLSGRSKSSTSSNHNGSVNDSMGHIVINESMVNDSVINDSMADDSVINDSIANGSMIDDSVVSDPDEMEHSHQGDISVQEVKSILEKSLVQPADDDDGDDVNDNADVNVDGRGQVDELDDSDSVPVKRPIKSRRSICAHKPVIESSDEEDEELDDSNHGADESNNKDGVISDDYDDNADDNQVDDDDDNESDGSDDNEGHESNLSDINNVSKVSLNESNNNKSISQNTSMNMDRVNGIGERPDSYTIGEVKDSSVDGEKERRVEDDDEEIGDGEDEEDEEDDSEEEEEEEEEEGFDDLPEESQIQYNQLVASGRLLCQQKNYEDGLTHVLQALEIFPDPDLQATAVNIQKKIMRNQMKKAMQ